MFHSRHGVSPTIVHHANHGLNCRRNQLRIKENLHARTACTRETSSLKLFGDMRVFHNGVKIVRAPKLLRYWCVSVKNQSYKSRQAVTKRKGRQKPIRIDGCHGEFLQANGLLHHHVYISINHHILMPMKSCLQFEKVQV